MVAYDKSIEKSSLIMFQTSIKLFFATISATLTTFYILGAISSIMLLIFLLPEKAIIILEPFSMVFNILWSLIKAAFFVVLFFMLIYVLVVLLNESVKIRNRITVRNNLHNLKVRAEMKEEIMKELKNKGKKK